jgi:DNA uptake protein ComE-like DNA-binding protein
MDMKKNENLATLPQITFNDTLVLNLTTEEHVKLEITNYLEEKYRSWIMVGALSFDDKVKADRYINLMTSDLYFYTFDNMMIDSENIETTSLYNVMNDEPEEEIQDKYMVSKSIIYIPSEMMNEQFKFNADKLKECIVTSKMKNDKSQYMFIIGIVVLFIIALFQSLYLWILFFKRRNKNNTTSQADSIESHQYKPEVTINSQEAKSRRAEASSHQPKATSVTTDSIIKGDRLDINKIDIYQFLSIPVMSYSQALLIIAERNDKGKYLDIEDLKSRNNLDPKIASALSERIYFG